MTSAKNLGLKLSLVAMGAAAVTLAGCGGDSGGDVTAPTQLSAAGCAALKEAFTGAGVRITESSVVNSTPATTTTAALPQHCKILGSIDERVGVDNQPYAIKFQVLAPLGEAWNRKFLFSGGGGSNGSIGNGIAVQGVSTAPLSRGYAVLTQDSGHDNAVNNLPEKSGVRTFNFDFQARVDNGYRSYDRATSVAKDVVRKAYGQAPERSYFAGCSEGGREALMLTQRFPEHFDGVVAGAPLLPAPFASLVRPAHIVQQFASLATKQGNLDRNGLPYINKTFTNEDRTVLTNGILAACDALDGATDGIVQDFKQCSAKFNPSTLQCSPGQTSGCLTGDQVGTLKTVMAGWDLPWNWDAGMVQGQMGSWWIGGYPAATAVQQAGSNWISSAYTTSYLTPVPAISLTANNGSDPFKSMLSFDLARDVNGVFATNSTHPLSTWEIMYATNPDLSRFRAKNGKVLMFHGVSDGAFTIEQSIKYLNEVDSFAGGSASTFMRLFPVPGMGHCSGGSATTGQFDMLIALENWVEKGTAPDSVLASAGSNTLWPGRTRPLCPYPKVAKYKGSGSLEDAANFTCQ